jgi:hypothetical protein
MTLKYEPSWEQLHISAKQSMWAHRLGGTGLFPSPRLPRTHHINLFMLVELDQLEPDVLWGLLIPIISRHEFAATKVSRPSRQIACLPTSAGSYRKRVST